MHSFKKSSMRTLFILSLLCVFIPIVSAQSATVVFSSEKDVEVSIYKPIDNTFNAYVVTDKLYLKPDIPINYQIEVADFCFLQCKYSDGRKYVLIVCENDKIMLNYSETGISISGNNKEGNVYLNEHFINPGFIKYSLEIDTIFTHSIKKKIQFSRFYKAVKDNILSDFYMEIESMKQKNQITPEFASIIYTDLCYLVNRKVRDKHWELLSGKRGKLSQSTITEIKQQMNLIYRTLSPIDINTLKYNYSSGYVMSYLKDMYNQLDSVAKKELIKGYDQETFGPLVSYLLAPDYMQCPLFGISFIIQFQYMVNEFDKVKMLQYLELKCKDSQYIELIKQQMENVAVVEDKTLKNDSVIFVNKPVNTLKELSELDGLKGKYIYIDLWATWCNPCKMEFLYLDNIHTFMDKYKNIVQVYISIDDDRFEDLWKKNITQFCLNGFNLRATDNLYKDIKDKIYNGATITIPRYVLLDENGKIVNSELPRPSTMDKFVDVITKIMDK